jgi:hypothetical protein
MIRLVFTEYLTGPAELTFSRSQWFPEFGSKESKRRGARCWLALNVGEKMAEDKALVGKLAIIIGSAENDAITVRPADTN